MFILFNTELSSESLQPYNLIVWLIRSLFFSLPRESSQSRQIESQVNLLIPCITIRMHFLAFVLCKPTKNAWRLVFCPVTAIHNMNKTLVQQGQKSMNSIASSVVWMLCCDCYDSYNCADVSEASTGALELHKWGMNVLLCPQMSTEVQDELLQMLRSQQREIAELRQNQLDLLQRVTSHMDAVQSSIMAHIEHAMLAQQEQERILPLGGDL